MNILGLTITRTKAATDQSLSPVGSHGGWWPIIRESFTGAWQQNVEISASSALTYSAVFACVTLIASDIAKLGLRLVQQDEQGIWTETTSPSFSPVLKKPNRYQSRIKFIEQWMTSKLTHGNTYVLKQRDGSNIVRALYVLDPTRVTPLVAQNGDVYYQLKRDDLSGLKSDTITVPASEIIHDTMVALYHPLVGVSPIYACGVAAVQGLAIQNNSRTFFANGSNPSGMLTAPAAISNETAQRLKERFDSGAFRGDNSGGVIVAGDGLKYEQFTMSAVDAQLIEQLKWTAETVCSCYHVPAYMIGIGPPPPYANVEPLTIQYYSQCLQSHIESLEIALDEGLGIANKIEGKQYGTEFDLDDLMRMDTASKTTAASTAISSGGMKPNEARKKYFGLGPVPGGDACYLQQQYYSLDALAQRDKENPLGKPAPAPPTPPIAPTPPDNSDGEDVPPDQMAASLSTLLRKELELAA